MVSRNVELRCCGRCSGIYPRTRRYFRRKGNGFDRTCVVCRKLMDEDKHPRANKRKGDPSFRRAKDREYNRIHAAERRKAAMDWQKAHPEQTRQNARNSYQRHREQRRENARQYQRKNPGKVNVWQHNARARRRGLPNTMTNKDVERAHEYFKGRCAVCGRLLQGLFHKAALDHWIPLADAEHCPGTVPTNMVPLCHGIEGCNNKKNDSEPHEWLVKMWGPQQVRVIERRIAKYFKWVSENDQ